MTSSNSPGENADLATFHGTIMQQAYGPAASQFGELYLPGQPEEGGPYPVVLLLHGGFWRVSYGLKLMAGLAEDLAKQGLAVWNIEYRRVGETGGGWPGTLRDVASAADFLTTLAARYTLDLRRVVAVGHSAGGQLALWLAARTRLLEQGPLASATTPLPLSGVVSLAGVNDLEHAWRLNLGHGAVAELLGGSLTDLPERYTLASPAAHLPLGVPQVLVHGSSDDRVPLEISQAYARKAMAAGDVVTLIELPGADHFVVIDPGSHAWLRTTQEIQKLLR